MQPRKSNSIADDLKQLLPHLAGHEEDKDANLEFLWVYEPPDHQGEEGKVHLANSETEHPADYPTHGTMATHVTHPDRMEGYAWSIKGGWRILDRNRKKVDPYIKRKILETLRGEVPPPPLPRIPYHGDPGPHEQ